MEDLKQVEHERISTSLEVETLDVNLFRSKNLWLPPLSRGVFGGQVISQALVSATNCVAPEYALHSMHCYFLASASPSTPILYHVEDMRTGRSYASRLVKAVQTGQTIFILVCSFQKPEPWQPSYQLPMPTVPEPLKCESEEVRYERLATQEGIHPRLKQYYLSCATERAKSPIDIRIARDHKGVEVHMYWMQARNIPHYDAPFQKCILGYLSDFHFISTAPRILGLKRFGKGPTGLAMLSSLDHSIYFYDNDFDCGDWLLYVMDSPRIGSGRGIMHGLLYSRSGKIVAVTSQEGVVRADIREPGAPNRSAKL
ncbi:C/M/P thioester hydrolase family protein [Pleurotus pulmonarius]